MASTDILLGRGVVTADSDDLGLCSDLRLRHDVTQVSIATWDATPIGGSAEVARRTRVFVDLTLHEMTALNRAKILDLIGDPDDFELVWTGLNTMAADCPSSSWVLTVPYFVLMPAAEVPLIASTLDDAALALTGEALRPSGTASWYTLVVS